MQDYYLQQFGIIPWVMRKQNKTPLLLDQLALRVAECTRCPLHSTRTQTVFSRGSHAARLMIVGDVPGFDEDSQGQPFVGKAGGLLNQMISSIGLSYDDVYISNVLKCRRPDESDAQLSEIQQCGSYLTDQIALVQPTLILALGKAAGQFLLNTSTSFDSMRASLHRYRGIQVIVSYHPVYLLQNPNDKKAAYQDWLTVSQSLAHAQPLS